MSVQKHPIMWLFEEEELRDRDSWFTMFRIPASVIASTLLFLTLAGAGCKSQSDKADIPDKVVFPNTDASCDEKVTFITNYVKDKRSCIKDSDCASAWEIAGDACEYYWLEVSMPDGGMGGGYDPEMQEGYIPAIQVSKIDGNFSGLTENLSENCCDSSDSSKSWGCNGIFDDPFTGLEAKCVSEKCQGYVYTSDESCISGNDAGW
jgi:hypothetical protein